MIADVRFPNSSTLTTPIGVGLATLMREPSPARQQRLLAAAYDAGIRHFDVAPSYGLGAAEAAVGRFLRTRPTGVTVATKVGILPRGNAALLRTIQRPARMLMRSFPALRGRTTRAVGAAVHTTPDLSPGTRDRSLEQSLRALGVDSIDVLLLHEPDAQSLVGAGVFEWLDNIKRRGLVRNVGVAAAAETVAAIAARNGRQLDVLQYPHRITATAPALSDAPGATRIVHSVLGAALPLAAARARSDGDWARALSERAGADVTEEGVLPRLLLACALEENRGGIVLIGSSTERHLRDAARAANAFRAGAIADAGSFLRQTLG